MDQNNFNNFKASVTKLNTKKDFLVTNSYGMKDMWRWFKKNKWLGLKEGVTEKEFGTIIKEVHNTFIERLISGIDIKFPYRMGKVTLFKVDKEIKHKNGRLVTNLPVNWQETLKYWYEDKDAKKNKRLIWCDWDKLFKINYVKKLGAFNNSIFYKLTFARSFKKKIHNSIINNKLDAFLVKRWNSLV